MKVLLSSLLFIAFHTVSAPFMNTAYFASELGEVRIKVDESSHPDPRIYRDTFPVDYDNNHKSKLHHYRFDVYCRDHCRQQPHSESQVTDQLLADFQQAVRLQTFYQYIEQHPDKIQPVATHQLITADNADAIRQAGNPQQVAVTLMNQGFQSVLLLSGVDRASDTADSPHLISFCLMSRDEKNHYQCRNQIENDLVTAKGFLGEFRYQPSPEQQWLRAGLTNWLEAIPGARSSINLRCKTEAEQRYCHLDYVVNTAEEKAQDN